MVTSGGVYAAGDVLFNEFSVSKSGVSVSEMDVCNDGLMSESSACGDGLASVPCVFGVTSTVEFELG